MCIAMTNNGNVCKRTSTHAVDIATTDGLIESYRIGICDQHARILDRTGRLFIAQNANYKPGYIRRSVKRA